MITVTSLKVESLVSPLGIATAYPRFSWQTESDISNFVQDAYRIELFENDKLIWDSGEVQSAESLNRGGSPRLAGCSAYNWRVSVKNQGKWTTSKMDSFETGMLYKAWKGKWIAGIHNGEVKQPVNYLRKSFHLDKDVASARLYSTALGVYDCAVNGKLISDECFAPGWTDYFFRVQQQTYDVTPFLRKGKNAIGVRLGEGWYCGSISRRRNSDKPSYGEVPSFRGEIHVKYTDGTTEIIKTDDSWLCSIGGPVRFSDIYDGEFYDAGFDLGNWTEADYPDFGWSHCLEKNRRIKIVGRTAPPVRRTEKLYPVTWRDIDPNLWKREPNIPDPSRLTIVDFGQNIVGRISLKIKLNDRQSISIRHGEILYDDGSLFLENLRSAKAAIKLTGNGKEFEYEPLFTFFGFRYLQITNLPESCDPSSICAYVMHSDIERTGYFNCSDKLLNRFYENQIWSQRDNYLDVPTDCPQRDERLGWLADAWIFAHTASYNFDIHGFFTKYMADVNTSCTGEGEYAQYAPFFAVNHLDAYWFGTEYYKGHNAWADGAIIIPYLMYKKYNDTRMLEEYYDNMKRWIYFQEANSDNLLRCSCVWRDWLNHNDPTSETLISTAFFAYGTKLMAKIAGIIGKGNDVEEFEKLYEAIRNAFCNKFITASGKVSENSQTAALLVLEFELAPENCRKAIFAQLVDNIVANGNRLSTGFLGTPFLLPVLTKFGRVDLAYTLLQQKEFPSWLYPVLQGATTIWERWNGYTVENGILPQPMNSFNHYAYGAAASFLYEVVGGIRMDEKTIGFRHFIIAPVPGGDLTEAETVYNSPYGKISTKWNRKNNKVNLHVNIPANTSATLQLPGMADQELGSGEYDFIFSDKKDK